MIRVLKYSLVFLFFVNSGFSFACSKSEIPYSVERHEKESYESSEDPFGFSVSLPYKYDEWQLDAVFYRIDGSHIPLHFSTPDDNDNVRVNFFATLDSLKESKVDASYKRIPDKDGNLYLCERKVVVDFGI